MPQTKKRATTLTKRQTTRKKGKTEGYKGFASYADYCEEIIVKPAERLFKLMQKASKKKSTSR